MNVDREDSSSTMNPNDIAFAAIDWTPIPCANKINLKEYAAMIQTHWNGIKEILDQPFQSLLSSFFPDLVVHPNNDAANKWQVLQHLTLQLKDSPQSIPLLQRRAIVLLQCNLAFDAYSHMFTIMEIMKRKRQYPQTPPALDKVRFHMEITRILSLLQMKNRIDIKEAFTPCIYYFFQYQSKIFPGNTMSSLFGPRLCSSFQSYCQFVFENSLQEETFYNYDDSCLVAIVLLYDALRQTASECHLEDASALERDRRMVITFKVFYLFHCDILERYRRLCDTSLDEPLSMSLPHRPMPSNLYAVLHLILSHNSLLKEYRSGSGGDREPNTVLRTLFALRRDVMKNIRVIPDGRQGGFKVVAKTKLNKGTIVLTEQAFASSTSLWKGDESYCCHCHCYTIASPPTKGKKAAKGSTTSTGCRCTGGCGAYYCSTICRDEAHQQYHRLLCCGSGWDAFLDSLQLQNCYSDFPFNAVLALKVMIIAECQGKKSIYDMPEFKILYRPTDTLLDPSSSLSSPPMLDNFPQGEKLIMIYKKFRTLCDVNLLSQYTLHDFAIVYGAVGKNTMGGWSEIPLSSATSTGKGNGATRRIHRNSLLVAASFVNHSCKPNACYYFNTKHHLVIQALETIEAGEEITISYLGNTDDMDLEVRQMNLMASYDFECQCKKCHGEREERINMMASSTNTGSSPISFLNMV